MPVSIYSKLSLFNAHTMILIFQIFMNVNKLCLNQKRNVSAFEGTERVCRLDKESRELINARKTSYGHNNKGLNRSPVAACSHLADE